MLVRDCMKREVTSIRPTVTIRQAAALIVERHVGLLPVVDEHERLIGVVRLHDLMSLELPDFVNLFPEVDFVHDFGAVETTRPEPELLQRQATTLMEPAISAEEDCGLLRAYALMLHHSLLDLPVVTSDQKLVGLASRVDIGVAILSTWQTSDSPS